MSKAKNGINGLSSHDLNIIDKMATLSFYPYMGDEEFERSYREISNFYEVIFDTKKHKEIYQHGNLRCLVFKNVNSGDIIFASSGTRLEISWEFYADFIDIVRHLANYSPHKCEGMELTIDKLMSKYEIADLKNLSIYFTGHSLGALVSSFGAGAFRAKIIKNFGKETLDQMQVRAISFENPGYKKTLSSFLKNELSSEEFAVESLCEQDLVITNRQNMFNSTQEQCGQHIEIGDIYSAHWRNAATGALIASAAAASGVVSPLMASAATIGFHMFSDLGLLNSQFQEHRIHSMQEPLRENITNSYKRIFSGEVLNEMISKHKAEIDSPKILSPLNNLLPKKQGEKPPSSFEDPKFVPFSKTLSQENDREEGNEQYPAGQPRNGIFLIELDQPKRKDMAPIDNSGLRNQGENIQLPSDTYHARQSSCRGESPSGPGFEGQRMSRSWEEQENHIPGFPESEHIGELTSVSAMGSDSEITVGSYG